MVAAFVLAFGIVTAITTLQRGLQAVDTARNYSYAGQLMQSELESLRLRNWSQLEPLQAAANRRSGRMDRSGDQTHLQLCESIPGA
jgi:Tfp pilus assembly protein PilV